MDFSEIDTQLLKYKGKIIHQVWFRFDCNSEKILQKFTKFRESWQQKNPSWYYFCWNETHAYELITRFYKEYYSMYRLYPYDIQRCDAIRYFILHRYGGLYVDMDYYCNRPFNDALQHYTNPIYFVEIPENKSSFCLTNALMYSTPNHLFWKQLFIELNQAKDTPIYYNRHMTIIYSTGPGILNHAYLKYKYLYNLKLFPFQLFHPHGWSDDILKITSIKNPNIYAMHMNHGSWEKEDSKIWVFLSKEKKILLFITAYALFICYFC